MKTEFAGTSFGSNTFIKNGLHDHEPFRELWLEVHFQTFAHVQFEQISRLFL